MKLITLAKKLWKFKSVRYSSLILASLVLGGSLVACSMLETKKKYTMGIEVKCPPETGGKTHIIPEILST